MSQENTSSNMGPTLMTFLAGAAAGAVVVALTTPKTGPQLRGDIKDLANRAKRKAGDLAGDARGAWDGMKERTSLAAGDIKHGMSDTTK